MVTSVEVRIDEDRVVQALAARIQVPVYGSGTLRRYLEDHDWNHDVAYEAFVSDRRALGMNAGPSEDTADTPVPTNELPDNIRGVPVIHHNNQEERRREALRLLRDVINIARDPNNKINLTLTEAFFSLVLAGWDVENAADRWASENIIRWQLHHTFDHLRPSTTDQAGIDERITRFVHFTGRDDWHSARTFLATHNQCFMEAVRAWYHHGMPAIRSQGWNDVARLFTGRRVTYEGRPRSEMPSGNEVVPLQVSNDVWAPNETSFRPTGQPPNDPAAKPLEKLHNTNKSKRGGFCFTPEGDAPVVGGVMPQHFTVDYLQNGKYRANGFSWENWLRPELPESNNNNPKNPQFDEYTRNHIAILGKWIRQEYSRIEGTKKRLRPQEFSKEEKKYLFELCTRHLKKLLDENPGRTSDDFRPLEFRKGATEQLEKDFNEAFEGKKPGSAIEPRRHRKGNALKVKCGRMKKFRDAFGFKNAAKGDDGDDSSEWSADEASSLPSTRLPSVSLASPSFQTAAAAGPPVIVTRQRNMDEEGSIAEIDTLALHHRRNVRNQAEQHWIDNGVLFPSEDRVALQMRIILQTESVNGKHTVQHAAVVRHLMRSIGMVIPEELQAYSSDGEVDMEISDESMDDANVENGEVEADLPEQEDELHDIDDLEFEPEYFDDDVLESDDN